MSINYTIETPIPQLVTVGCGVYIPFYGWCFDTEHEIRGISLCVDQENYSLTHIHDLRTDVFSHYKLVYSGYRSLCSGFYGIIPFTQDHIGKNLKLVLNFYYSNNVHSVDIGFVYCQAKNSVEKPPESLINRDVDEPLIAVCMATYNPKINLFEKQIESIINQTHKNWILIINDDNSSKNSFQEICRVCEAEPRIHIFRNDSNLGFYKNFERVLQRVSDVVQYVAFADQDDYWYENKLSLCLARMEPDVSLVYSDMRIVRASGEVISNTFWVNRQNYYEDISMILLANTVTGAACLFRRNLLEILLPFPYPMGDIYHDQWLSVVARAVGRIAYIDQPLYDYIQHGTNVTGHSDLKVASPSERLSRALKVGVKVILGLSHSIKPKLRNSIDIAWMIYKCEFRRFELMSSNLRLRVGGKGVVDLTELDMFNDRWFSIIGLMKKHLMLLQTQTTNHAEWRLLKSRLIVTLSKRFVLMISKFLSKNPRTDNFNQQIIAKNHYFPAGSDVNNSHVVDRIEQLQSQLQQARNEIAAMKTSKFWKLRTIWFKFKFRFKPIFNILRITVDDLDSNLVSLPGVTINNSMAAKESLTYKETLRKIYTTYLQSFINSKVKLQLPTHSKPLISIILVLYNRAELTLQCLLSLAANCTEPFEIIIVDNASSDYTGTLLNQLAGVKIIRNRENLHFLLASNQAAQEAIGEYILFLNNDTQVLPGSITSAIATITKSDDIGVVGGKIILFDGSLQEAGSIIWKDGSCSGYGRGDSPFEPMYMFSRDVDYCSGAFLLTKRSLFRENGGFDQDYKPAYYEETDYCLRLWSMSQRVVYDPNVVILHYEFASSTSVDSALSLQLKNRDIFVAKHREKLQYHYSPESLNIHLARDVHNYSGRVLFVEDRVPHSFLGRGLPRANEILHSLLQLNYFVTLFPLVYCEEEWNSVYQDVPNNVEIMIGYGLEKFESFLCERKEYYNIVFISRPHNFKALQSVIVKKHELFPNIKFIYDAEALFSMRDISKSRLTGNQISENEINRILAQELDLPKYADRIVSVSAQEGKNFTEYGYKQVYTLGHLIAADPTENSFEDRSDILFVGSIDEDDSPNADSIYWFVKEILPILQEHLGSDLNLHIVGFTKSQKILDLSSENVKIWGAIDNIKPFFNSAKIFIAPTRFAAGIPMKVHTAASYGLPIVATSLIASQVGWENGSDLLTADDHISFAQKCIYLYTHPDLWQTLRGNALNRVSKECSKEVFMNNLKGILEF